MKVGPDISVLAEPGRPDSSVLSEHLALADLAEPLGFDSLFSLEHHFTGYSMSPSPLQILSYFAGRTRRITLGTCVIVLPWQDPIRVAEQIAYLDLLCRGRCMFGFGRGAATAEYEGFRIPMEEARPRFAEAAQLVTKALRDPGIELSLRPLDGGRSRPVRAPLFASGDWTPVDVSCPRGPFTVVASDASTTAWFAFRKPTEIGWASAIAESMIYESWAFGLAALVLALGAGVSFVTQWRRVAA